MDNDEKLPLHNIADEVLCVKKFAKTGNISTSEQTFQRYVYSDEQIQDMKSNCIGTNGSVIGIGRTFNLRSCFVTTTTYKILVIPQRETSQNLIFLDTRDIKKYNFNGTDISPLGRQN